MRDDPLQIAENPAFQRQVWRSQRLGWIGLALLLGLAAIGVTGDGGPFARLVFIEGPVTADMPRVARIGAADGMSLATVAAGGQVSLHLDSAFVRAFEIEGVSPAPMRQEARADGLALTIATQGGGPLDIRLSVRAITVGWRSYAVTLDGRRITLSSLVLP